jgi:1-acyl-sn-glycerol-3-phosphate acyltransferase
MTAVGFAVFGIGGLIATLIIFPVIALVSGEATRRANTRSAIRVMFKAYVATLRGIGIFRFVCTDERRLRELRGVIVASNHPTLLDVVLIMSLLRDAQCIVKPALWKNPFLGGVVRAAGYLRSDAPAEELVSAGVASLGRGENLVIFPQGTRTPPGEEVRLHRGAAHIALQARADVQILIIHCEPLMLSKAVKWYDIPKRRPVFTLVVGDCLDTHPYLGYPSKHTGAQRMMDTLAAYFAEGAADGPRDSRTGH